MSLSLATSSEIPYDNVSTSSNMSNISILSISIYGKAPYKLIISNNHPMVTRSKMRVYKPKAFTLIHVDLSLIEPSSTIYNQ